MWVGVGVKGLTCGPFLGYQGRQAVLTTPKGEHPGSHGELRGWDLCLQPRSSHRSSGWVGPSFCLVRGAPQEPDC